MENQEFKRYDRQIQLEELGLEGQKKLKNASVLVVGAGGLGCPLLLYLVAAGIGKIGIIDHDSVDETNLQRQILFNTADIGKNKALTATAKLQLLNPYVSLQAYPEKLLVHNANSLIASYDLIVDGSDNFPTRYLVNDTCVALNKPLVFGSIYKFEGQVSVFNYNTGPNYRDLYPEPPLADKVPNCGESGVIGPLPGIIGSIMANEAIKVICGFAEPLSGKLLVLNALNNESMIFNINASTLKGETSIQQNNASTQPSAVASAVGENPNTNIAATDKQVKQAPFQRISLDELREWELNNEPFCLVDVREAYEFEEHNIGGINISLYELKDQMQHIPADQKLIFCCQSGSRSKMAIKIIKDIRTDNIFIINLLDQ